MKRAVILVLLGGLLNAAALDATCYRDNDKNVVICSEAKLGKLMWQDEVRNFEWTWEQANEYCRLINIAGFDDWRLPTIDELISITDKSKINPAINSAFKNTEFNWYWSSTRGVDDPSRVWAVNFWYGDYWNNASGRCFVRCVRDD